MGLNPASRPFTDEQDLHEMQAMLMQARRQSGDWRYAHVGELTFQYLMVACHLNPRDFIRLWHAGGRLVGYAVLGEDPSFDFQILPEFAWSGIEEEAVRWAEEEIARLRKADPQQWGGKCTSGSRQDDPERMAFLELHGFKPGGEFSEVNMLRLLDDAIPAPEPPDGYWVRELAGAGELSNRAGAQREVWKPWTVGNVYAEDYARLMRLPCYHRELDVVAVAPDGVIASYVNGWIDELNRIGDFGPVGARPAYRRKGLTRAVLLECLRRMKARGMNRVCVSTGVSNFPAIRLYESVGFQTVNQFIEYVKP
jgi:mycothiol synthase